jgi:hypothetical protein
MGSRGKLTEGGYPLVPRLVLVDFGPDPQRLIHTEDPVDIWNLFHNKPDVK